MAKTITLTFSDAIFTRVVKALTLYFGYQPTIDDGQGTQIPNPQSRKDFLIMSLKTWLLHIAKDTEINDSMADAVAASNAALETQRQAARTAAEELDLTITSG